MEVPAELGLEMLFDLARESARLLEIFVVILFCNLEELVEEFGAFGHKENL